MFQPGAKVYKNFYKNIIQLCVTFYIFALVDETNQRLRIFVMHMETL